MGWRGSKDEADENAVKSRIKEFLKNYKKKCSRNSVQESLSQGTQVSHQGVSENFLDTNKCFACGTLVELLQHLNQNKHCLTAYVSHFLPSNHGAPQDSDMYRRKSLFQLSTVLSI